MAKATIQQSKPVVPAVVAVPATESPRTMSATFTAHDGTIVRWSDGPISSHEAIRYRGMRAYLGNEVASRLSAYKVGLVKAAQPGISDARAKELSKAGKHGLTAEQEKAKLAEFHAEALEKFYSGTIGERSASESDRAAIFIPTLEQAIFIVGMRETEAKAKKKGFKLPAKPVKGKPVPVVVGADGKPHTYREYVDDHIRLNRVAIETEAKAVIAELERQKANVEKATESDGGLF